MIKENYTPEALQGILAEAHFHLGRVLYEHQIDYDRAVSELEVAVDMDPENIAAFYHLGQAILEQIEHDKMKRAEEVLSTYMWKGAPLGHEDQIRSFLITRQVTRRSQLREDYEP